MTEHVLISPLGFAAGAVSGVYFALKEREVAAEKVITVGTRHEDVRNAADILARLFRRVGDVDYNPCYIDAIDLKGPERNASGPFAARMGLYIDQARNAGQTVHVAVTGGRSGMGALAALAAQLYRADHLYHLWVDEEIELHGIARAEPDIQNKYVNPTIEPDLCELVALPFADLSDLTEGINYKQGAQFLETRTAHHLVQEGPAMLKALSYYVPAGLSLGSAHELLNLVQQWREQGEWIIDDIPGQARKIPSADKSKQEKIWQRALSILYTAGALDDGSRRRLRELMRDSIADDYGQRALEKAAQGDDLGFFKWLTQNEEALATLSKVVTTGASVGTFVLKGIELWLKSQGMM